MGLTGEQQNRDTRVLGIVVLQERAASIPSWEADAQRVDKEERLKAAGLLIDAEHGGTDVPR
jgi:hypothetical protein